MYSTSRALIAVRVAGRNTVLHTAVLPYGVRYAVLLLLLLLQKGTRHTAVYGTQYMQLLHDFQYTDVPAAAAAAAAVVILDSTHINQIIPARDCLYGLGLTGFLLQHASSD